MTIMSGPETRDFLALSERRDDEIMAVIERAQCLAERWRMRRMPQSLEGTRIGLIVDDGGWRNTTAFDLGTRSMGGICVHMPISFQGREPVADLAAYVDNWVDATVVRTPDLALLREFAHAAQSPVINARTRSNHPCETLGDLCFVRRVRGTIEGLRVVAVAPDDNILRSWVEAATVLPITVIQVYPKRWHVRDPLLSPPRFSATSDLAALTEADLLITDCWPRGAGPSELSAYQITAAVLQRLKPGSLFVPCPPVTRGQEVTDEAMQAPACRVVEAKAYLLHAQNAVLEWVCSAVPSPAGAG